MKELSKEKFEEFYDGDSGEVFGELVFNKCEFSYCNLSQTKNPFNRTTVRNILLKNCVATQSSIGCAALENVTVDGLRMNGLLQIWGAVFSQVRLVGKLGKIMITNGVAGTDEEVSSAFLEENKAYYSSVDWALDISEGEFLELDIRGIPSDLIKIDSSTQAILRKKNVPDNWREIELNNPRTKLRLKKLVEWGWDDCVYVAPKRDKKNFESMLQDVKLLRELGIADPA